MLLYDDLVGVVTSHVTKMAVTPLDPPWPKPQGQHGSKVMKPPQSLPQTANGGTFLGAQLDSVAYHVTARSIGD